MFTNAVPVFNAVNQVLRGLVQTTQQRNEKKALCFLSCYIQLLVNGQCHNHCILTMGLLKLTENATLACAVGKSCLTEKQRAPTCKQQ